MIRLFVLSFLLLISALAASSQRIYFIYFQTETQQPFFIKMDEKLYSSTSSGYLILSRLKDSTYSFTVGFPGNQFSEQKFSCTLGKKDHGYLVKNFGDKGWGLIDLQSQSVQMAANDTKKDVSITNAPVNAFTDLLAKAADDSTLKQKVVLPDEKKPDVAAQTPAAKEAKKDSAITTTGNSKISVAQADSPDKSTKTEAKKDADIVTTGTSKATIAPANSKDNSITTEAKKDSAVAKANNLKTGTLVTVNSTEGSFKKETNKSPDTANKNTQVTKEVTTIKPVEDKTGKSDSILHEESKIQNTGARELQSQQPVFAKTKIARTSGNSTTEGFGLTFIDTYQDGNKDTIKILIPGDNNQSLSNDSIKDAVEKKTENLPIAIKEENSVKAISKNNCRQIASDADFYKLRKKMAVGKSDASMLDEANKAFRVKCFTTSQIKNLGSLFLGDGGKYSFFDAAYVHVSDTENFSALQSELKDEYFINRFKALLR